MRKLLSLIVAIAILLSACNDDNNEDQSKTVDKAGSIEVSLSTKHLDSLKDILITHYTVWRKGVMVKQYDKTDTLPSLGLTLAEDGSDDINKTIPRDYEFFVTVK